ncbi:hypothetical protein [Flindersiella endophytica]
MEHTSAPQPDPGRPATADEIWESAFASFPWRRSSRQPERRPGRWWRRLAWLVLVVVVLQVQGSVSALLSDPEAAGELVFPGLRVPHGAVVLGDVPPVVPLESTMDSSSWPVVGTTPAPGADRVLLGLDADAYAVAREFVRELRQAGLRPTPQRPRACEDAEGQVTCVIGARTADGGTEILVSIQARDHLGFAIVDRFAATASEADRPGGAAGWPVVPAGRSAYAAARMLRPGDWIAAPGFSRFNELTVADGSRVAGGVLPWTEGGIYAECSMGGFVAYVRVNDPRRLEQVTEAYEEQAGVAGLLGWDVTITAATPPGKRPLVLVSRCGE